MASKRILESTQPACAQLDAMIKQMETTLGKAHTESPFNVMYQKHGFATQVPPVVAEKVEEKKEMPAKQQP
jgi:hypothetical protein